MTKDTGLLSLAAIARLHSGAVDTEQLFNRFALADRPLTSDELVRAAKTLGMSAKLARFDIEKIEQSLLPIIGHASNGKFFTILRKRSDNELLGYFPETAETRAVTVAELRDLNVECWIVLRKNLIKTASNAFGFGWFIPALKRYKHLFAEVVLLSFFLQVFALMTPLFFQLVMDKVLVHRGFTTLEVLAVGFLALALFDAVMGGLRNYLFAHTANRVDVELGAKLYQHLLRLPQAYFEARQVGQSVARVRELETIRNFITGTALTLIVDLSFTFVFFGVMYLYSPLLTAVVAAAIPFYILLSILITPILRRRLDQSFQRGAENQALLVESVSGIETVKALSLENQFQRRWEEQLAGYVKASFKAANLNNIANQSAQLINKLTTLGIVFFGAHLVIDGMLTVGELVAFNMLAGRVSAPILKLVQLWQEFQQAGISMRRLGELLNTPAEQSANGVNTVRPRGYVSFEAVSFRYGPETSKALETLSFTAAAGQKIGIVGRSGSGKSTLTKLLQRIYRPESGRVLEDGQDIAQADLTWLRRNVGVVLQESRLFDGTIRDNIAITRPSATQAEILNAAQLAGATEFIGRLPKGMDYAVGEGGCNLSGGQRQRIAIARALIANPAILIFDEATSALDYESEALIQRNLNQIGANRTLLIVAHRLASVRDCDQILVLDKGQIIDRGTHTELLNRAGLYADLWRLQTEGCSDKEVRCA
jgi:subfamily B ATP-binding cassette protein HlyB/CyaB